MSTRVESWALDGERRGSGNGSGAAVTEPGGEGDCGVGYLARFREVLGVVLSLVLAQGISAAVAWRYFATAAGDRIVPPESASG